LPTDGLGERLGGDAVRFDDRRRSGTVREHGVQADFPADLPANDWQPWELPR
jgi:hypothetical protein